MEISIVLTMVYIAVGEIIGSYIMGELLISALLKRKQLFSEDKTN